MLVRLCKTKCVSTTLLPAQDVLPIHTDLHTSYFCLHLYTSTQSMKPQCNMSRCWIGVNHTKMSESLKPELQQPHECVPCTNSASCFSSLLLSALFSPALFLTSSALELFALWTRSQSVSLTALSFCRKVLHDVVQMEVWVQLVQKLLVTTSSSSTHEASSSFKNTTSSFRLSWNMFHWAALGRTGKKYIYSGSCSCTTTTCIEQLEYLVTSQVRSINLTPWGVKMSQTCKQQVVKVKVQVVKMCSEMSKTTRTPPGKLDWIWCCW